MERVFGVGDADVFGLCAVNQVSKDPADPGLPFLAHAVRVEPGLAVGAVPAGLDAGNNDAVPHLQSGHGGPGLGDGSYALVAEDPALGYGGHVALEDVE